MAIREWKFYGRKTALEKVQFILQLEKENTGVRKFGAHNILGRRGIGKSSLLLEAKRRSGNNIPILIA